MSKTKLQIVEKQLAEANARAKSEADRAESFATRIVELAADARRADLKATEARKAVDTLKEKLHQAELETARLRGKLERIDDLERKADIPVETRTITQRVVAAPEPVFAPNYGGCYAATEKEQHWTSL